MNMFAISSSTDLRVYFNTNEKKCKANQKNFFKDLSKEIDPSNLKNELEAKSQGLWEKIKTFFANIWAAISGVFQGGNEEPTQTTN